MAKTLLNGVNDLLKLAQIIQGESQQFTTLTDRSRQTAIDVAVMAWNWIIDELYRSNEGAFTAEAKESTITLATNTREYTLPTDLVLIRWPLINETTGQVIDFYPGGYEGMRNDQLIPADYTGLPMAACINPTNNKLRLECAPTADENGLVYKMLYDKDTVMSAASDSFPFSDAVYRAALHAAHQLWRRSQQKAFDEAVFKTSLARAATLLTQKPRSSSWAPIRSDEGFNTDPMEAN